MDLRKLFLAVTVFLMLAVTLVVTGCNTWHGAGKDVERTGEAMQGK
jgi:predicted small secreted protein